MKRSKFILHEKKEQPKENSPSVIDEFPVGILLKLPKSGQIFKVISAPSFYSNEKLKLEFGCSVIMPGVYLKILPLIDDNIQFMRQPPHLIHIADLKNNFIYAER